MRINKMEVVRTDLENIHMLAFLPLISSVDNFKEISYGESSLINISINDSNRFITSSQSNINHASSNNWQVFFLLIIEAAGILGNLLVCVSVAIDRRLRTITNYILVSLAIADLFVSLIVMPGYIAQEYKGYWPFGLIMCTLWQMSDVTMCTSSIMHMCIISLDRYKCIRDPMSIRSRSKISMGLRIAAVWFFAVIISTPLAFLAAFRPSEILNSRSECIISNPNFLVYGSIAAFFLPLIVMLITYSLTINLLRRKAVEIERSGVLRRSVSKRRHRSKRNRSPLKTTMSLNEGNKWQYSITSTTRDGYSSLNGRHQIDNKLASLNSGTIEMDKPEQVQDLTPSESNLTPTVLLKRPHPRSWYKTKTHREVSNSWKMKEERLSEEEEVVETYFPADVGPQNTDASIAPLLSNFLFRKSPNEKIANRRQSLSASDLRSSKKILKMSNSKQSDSMLSDLTSLRYYYLHHSNPKLTKKESPIDDSKQITSNFNTLPSRNTTIQRVIEQEKSSFCSLDESTTLANNSNSDIRTDSDFTDLTHSQPQTAPVSSNNLHKKCRFLENFNNISKSQIMEENQENEFSRTSSKSKRHDKHISKTVTNERKAVKVLGLMFLMFVACWAVFFCVNLAMGVCPECKFDESFFKYVLWLGYTSSLINPIIYTVFNLSFRRAFIRILTCQYCRYKSLKFTQTIK